MLAFLHMKAKLLREVPSFLLSWPMPKIELHGVPLPTNYKKSGRDEYLPSQHKPPGKNIHGRREP